ncbi:hypothetical protein [Actinacidiphila oryziradicis]|uniref:Uncharacterized protein n=1 Tax=Actinacidiphila oryziradicis TaxID=2571141 RepID=A0A4U0S4K6_9ACTN|nr:hypothetical protein [Actinacidiphila oryziradicis]TKA01991.1 hypothetical protein FCI23_39675 [Actinacidiphila oryziradicis]
MARSIAAHLGRDGRTREEAQELGIPFTPLDPETLLVKYRSLMRRAAKEPDRVVEVEPVIMESGEAVVPGEVVDGHQTYTELSDISELQPPDLAQVLLAAAAQALAAEHRAAEHFAGLVGLHRRAQRSVRVPSPALH